MHDGSLPTLWDVMDHYNKGGEANPYLDGGIEPLALTRARDRPAGRLHVHAHRRRASPTQNEAELARQKALAAKQRPFRDDALANAQGATRSRRRVARPHEGSK